MKTQLVSILYSGNFGEPRTGIIVKEDANYVHFVEAETGAKMRIGHNFINEILELEE